MRFFITFQIDLDKEKNEYGDILQLSIEEGYENLAYKTLAGFAWIWRQYGENLQWIIKLDDDLDLNLDKFLNKLPSTGKSLSEALLFAEHGENMLCTKIVLNVRSNFCTQHVLPRFELGIFTY